MVPSLPSPPRSLHSSLFGRHLNFILISPVLIHFLLLFCDSQPSAYGTSSPEENSPKHPLKALRSWERNLVTKMIIPNPQLGIPLLTTLNSPFFFPPFLSLHFKARSPLPPGFAISPRKVSFFGQLRAMHCIRLLHQLKNVLGNSSAGLEATTYLLKRRRLLSKCSATNPNTSGIFLQPPWLSQAFF